MNEQPYVSSQICVLKTDKKLVAFYDKLRVASVYNYSQLHADGEYMENNRKVRSLIGITLLDYSQGTGQNTVTVKANLLPDEIFYIFSRLQAGFPVFEFRQDKIFGNKDENGYSSATKLSITRNTQDYKGEPLRIPWKITMENGKGIAVKNQTGGTYMQKNSFQCTAKASISITDADMFVLLNRVTRYITMWMITVSPSLISNGKNAMQAALMQKQQALQTQASYQEDGYAA
ncbi:hypothetical protein CE91St62_39240 [Lachnospiraceae bacterium]|uniref:hypothetical protein n=1 Tax=Extibacter sp. GGCC_0201 TaxID=2731209 RepID=UPI001AA0B77F|nr:hypothetical protein [Extibacter sp. GGCC_0201]MBO1720712.1 hypothetical protein [Extibacter sp. GGCC_0201]BDF35862.1 hypothetical protein CE91St61_39370 [Lachnospiraceae bacterium]BDF39863.1 hypothetical protein CE91St62_39240 [Lachnospiraceae bacterium]